MMANPNLNAQWLAQAPICLLSGQEHLTEEDRAAVRKLVAGLAKGAEQLAKGGRQQ